MISMSMNLADVVFWGWYQILDKTVYLNSTGQRGIGPKEHSFFITFLLHGINAWTVIRYLFIKYFDGNVNLYFSLSIAIIVFFLGYLVYFRKGRANKVISSDVNNFKLLFFITVSLVYAVASVYFMLSVGNYVRYKLHG